MNRRRHGVVSCSCFKKTLLYRLEKYQRIFPVNKVGRKRSSSGFRSSPDRDEMARKKTRFDIEDVEDDTYSLEETMGISLALKESERGLHSDANSPSKTIASRFSAMTPEKTSPGTPESDIGSLSYTKTAEAVPMTLLYRQDSAQRGAELPRRPTLKDLHDPIQVNGD